MRHTYALAIVGTSLLSVCSSPVAAKSSSYTKVEPATSNKEDGINKVTFTEKAMERIGVKTRRCRKAKLMARRTPHLARSCHTARSCT